jgi:hypothetical protein
VAFIKACAIAAGDGVEHQEGFATFAGDDFGLSQEGGAETFSAGPPMDEHFREIGAVRLILGEVENELNRAADALLIVRDEDRAFAGGDATRDAAPERNGSFARERVHEADGRASLDAINQDIGEFFDEFVAERIDAARVPDVDGHQSLCWWVNRVYARERISNGGAAGRG